MALHVGQVPMLVNYYVKGFFIGTLIYSAHSENFFELFKSLPIAIALALPWVLCDKNKAWGAQIRRRCFIAFEVKCLMACFEMIYETFYL